MTHVESEPEVHAKHRQTVFGKEIVSQNKLLQQLGTNDEGKVRLSSIQAYIQQSMSRDTTLSWYKFAGAFAVIVIILQSLSTFGVAIWANNVTRTIYVGAGTETSSNVLTNSNGEALDATGYVPADIVLADIYDDLEAGTKYQSLSGTLFNDDLEPMNFDFQIEGNVKVGNSYTLYTTNGVEIEVDKDGMSVEYKGQEYTTVDTNELDDAGRRRMLTNCDSEVGMDCSYSQWVAWRKQGHKAWRGVDGTSAQGAGSIVYSQCRAKGWSQICGTNTMGAGMGGARRAVAPVDCKDWYENKRIQDDRCRRGVPIEAPDCKDGTRDGSSNGECITEYGHECSTTGSGKCYPDQAHADADQSAISGITTKAACTANNAANVYPLETACNNHVDATANDKGEAACSADTTNECQWTPPDEYETSCYMGQAGSYWGGAYKTCNRATCEAAGVCIVNEDAQLGTCLKTDNYRAPVSHARTGTCSTVDGGADPTTCVGLGGTWTATQHSSDRRGGTAWTVVSTNNAHTSGDELGTPVQAWECGNTDRRGRWSSRGTRRGNRYRYAWDYMGSKKCDALGGNWVPATWKGMSRRAAQSKAKYGYIKPKYQAALGCEYHPAVVMANNLRAAADCVGASGSNVTVAGQCKKYICPLNRTGAAALDQYGEADISVKTSDGACDIKCMAMNAMASTPSVGCQGTTLIGRWIVDCEPCNTTNCLGLGALWLDKQEMPSGCKWFNKVAKIEANATTYGEHCPEEHKIYKNSGTVGDALRCRQEIYPINNHLNCTGGQGACAESQSSPAPVEGILCPDGEVCTVECNEKKGCMGLRLSGHWIVDCGPGGRGCQYIWLNGDNQACVNVQDCQHGLETSYGVGGGGAARESDLCENGVCGMNGGLPGCQGAHPNCSSNSSQQDPTRNQCNMNSDLGCYWKGVYKYT